MNLKKYLFIISILNSIYLSYINLKGFLFEQNLLELEKSFTVVIFTNPFILVLLYYIQSIVKKKNLGENISQNIILGIITIMFGSFIYNALRDSNFLLYEQIASIIFEIISISMVMSKERERKILDLVSYFFLCFLTGIFCFSCIGFLEEYLFPEDRLSKKLRIIYTAAFFHFFNACFLLWKSLFVNKYNNQLIIKKK